MIRTVKNELVATNFESEFKLEKAENCHIGNIQVIFKEWS